MVNLDFSKHMLYKIYLALKPDQKRSVLSPTNSWGRRFTWLPKLIVHNPEKNKTNEKNRKLSNNIKILSSQDDS